jgi:hypothetical protein
MAEGATAGGVLPVKAVDIILLCLGIATFWIASRSFVRNLSGAPIPHRVRKLD